MSHDQRLNDGTIDPELATSPVADSKARMHGTQPPPANGRMPLFRTIWYLCTALLIVSILLLAYSAAWEYSTRRYLKGFSDAVVPADSTPVEKIQAILHWMSSPAAQDTGASVAHQDRNPEDTLNYTSLLKVCGTATNAFINLADSAGLSARRLLLLDSHRHTLHVVAEVSIAGRWIVVDPVFGYIPHGPDGALLTHNELADPKIFSAATRNVPNYDAAYNYQLTAHVHLARLPYVGSVLRQTLNAVFPGWSNSPTVSLLLERDSLALLAFSVVLICFALVSRLILRRYAAVRFGIRPPHAYTRLSRAIQAFFGAAG